MFLFSLLPISTVIFLSEFYMSMVGSSARSCEQFMLPERNACPWLVLQCCSTTDCHLLVFSIDTNICAAVVQCSCCMVGNTQQLQMELCCIMQHCYHTPTAVLQHHTGTQLYQLQGRYYADLMHHSNSNYTIPDQMAIQKNDITILWWLSIFQNASCKSCQYAGF